MQNQNKTFKLIAFQDNSYQKYKEMGENRRTGQQGLEKKVWYV